jgi:hypothetical protein
LTSARTAALLALLGFSVPSVALAKDDDRPTERIPGIKAKVFDIKHRSTDDVLDVIRLLGSGVKGTSLSDNNDLRTITVRDFPENILAIEDAIKRVDVPSMPKPDVELRMRVLIAAPTGSGQHPTDLDAVIKQLRATLNYKSYNQIASITQRVKAGAGAGGKGQTQLAPPVSQEPSSANYSYSLEGVNVITPPPGAAASAGGNISIQIKKLKFWTGNKQLGEADINTGLSLREGEKVVVGSASLKDRAMILVLSAKLLK